MQNTAAAPEVAVYQVLNGTGYYFIHPAPTVAAQCRVIYWRRPVTATVSVAPDWPTDLRGLLLTALRRQMASDAANHGVLSLEDSEFQRQIDVAFSSLKAQGPIPVTMPGRRSGRTPINGIGANFSFPD